MIRRSQKGRHEERAMHNRTNSPHLHDNTGWVPVPTVQATLLFCPNPGRQKSQTSEACPSETFWGKQVPINPCSLEVNGLGEGLIYASQPGASMVLWLI